MKIIVKSNPTNWEKERSGRKANTLRKLDGKDVIEIINTETGDRFERPITDITEWEGSYIISFEPKKELSMPESEVKKLFRGGKRGRQTKSNRSS
jgi:hypothetical protein